jgi:hypothetical protein
VARNEWLPMGAKMSAAAARRRIIRQASGCPIAWSDSRSPRRPLAVRNSAPFLSSPIPAASIYRCNHSAKVWWQGMMCNFPPFSCSRSTQPAPRGRKSSTRMASAAPIRAKL